MPTNTCTTRMIVMLPVALLAIAGCSSQKAAAPAAPAVPAAAQASAPAAAPASKSAQAAPSSAVQPASKDVVTLTAASAPVKESQALAHGPVGLVICDPVPGGDAAPSADFGAGCSRWIQFQTAGQPQMQRTTHWPELYRAAHEVGHEDLKLAKSDALWFAKAIGATHAAVATLVGSGGNLTLRYDLIALPSGQEVGKPIVISGSREQISSALPVVASNLCVRLGIHGAAIPSHVDLDSSGLETVGRSPWRADGLISAADIVALDKLGQKSPLACMASAFAMRPRRYGSLRATVNRLLQLAPENQYSYGCMGYVYPNLLPSKRESILTFVHKYPDCYLAHWTAWGLSRAAENPDQVRHELLALERICPANPNVWITAARVESAAAARIRYGRFAGAMSQSEWKQLGPLYEAAYNDEVKAVTLDPKYGHAWAVLAEHATFAGKDSEADAALWKAVKLDPDTWDACSWGLQMYQSKWGGNPANLEKVARLIATLPDAPLHLGEVRDALKEAGMQPLCSTLESSVIAASRTAVAHNPNDPDTLYAQAVMYSDIGTNQPAVIAYQSLLKVEPDDIEALNGLAEAYKRVGDVTHAEQEYRSIIQQQPEDAGVHCNLADLLKDQRRIPEASAEYHKAISINPTYTTPNYGLAQIAIAQQNTDEAIRQLEVVTRAQPWNEAAFEELSKMYLSKNRLKEAASAANGVLRIHPGNHIAHAILGYIYAVNHDNEKSAKENEIAITLAPDNVMAHENLGDALNELGRRAAARTQWTWVVTHAPNDGAAGEARKNLSQYP